MGRKIKNGAVCSKSDQRSTLTGTLHISTGDPIELGITFASRSITYRNPEFQEWESSLECLMESIMLSWALTFLVLALIAALFGFGGIAASAASIAKVLFFLFIVLFVFSLLANMVRGRDVV